MTNVLLFLVTVNSLLVAIMGTWCFGQTIKEWRAAELPFSWVLCTGVMAFSGLVAVILLPFVPAFSQ